MASVTVQVTVVVLAAPANLTLTLDGDEPNSGTGSGTLSWDDDASVAFYDVTVSTDGVEFVPFETDGLLTRDGTTATMTLTGLTDNETYCIAITATNTSDLRSGYSLEATGKPTLVIGLKAPGFISDLVLERSTNDLLLSWGEVTTDIFGNPKTIDHYEIHRGETPDFQPSGATLIGSPTVASFTDVGAAGTGAPDYHYLVRAVDAAGVVGQRAGRADLENAGRLPGKAVLRYGERVRTRIRAEPRRTLSGHPRE